MSGTAFVIPISAKQALASKSEITPAPCGHEGSAAALRRDEKDAYELDS